MPINKLTDVRIEALLRSARKRAVDKQMKTMLIGDGGGLTLQITKSASASWLFRCMIKGRPIAMGLGPYPSITLREARDKAGDCRRLVAAGINPLLERRAAATQALAPDAKKTFGVCALQYIDDHRPEWRSEKHAQQWLNTLQTFAFPIVGHLDVDAVTTPHVVSILKPIWVSRTETARRLRGRLESVLSWAAVQGLRSSENPARYRGHLEHLLPRTTPRERSIEHHPALPHEEVPQFFSNLYAQDGLSRWALELLILTATRTTEVRLAKWSEFDLERCLWTIPKDRMKSSREHRIPLTPRMIHILCTLAPFRKGDFVFPGRNPLKGLSNMAMLNLLKRMGYGHVTVHGFRSSFRDFCSERTEFPDRVAEAALAHKIENRTEGAYARSDLFEKRRALMVEWQTHCLRTVQLL